MKSSGKYCLSSRSIPCEQVMPSSRRNGPATREVTVTPGAAAARSATLPLHFERTISPVPAFSLPRHTWRFRSAFFSLSQ
jgi:hypothetical protein